MNVVQKKQMFLLFDRSDRGSLLKKIVLLLSVTLLFLFGSFALNAFGEEQESSEARKAWKAIKEFHRKKDLPGERSYWHTVIPSSLKPFDQLTSKGSLDANVRYYVSQFGKDDAETDFRWMITLWYNACGPEKGAGPSDKSDHPQLFKVKCMVAKHQVLLFMKDKKLLDRYYNAIVWHGKFFKPVWQPIRAGITSRKIDRKKKEEYWWYARSALLFIHATERDDLLKDASPDKLDEVYKKWYSWYKKEGIYLRTRQNRLKWYLDEGEKERQEGYIPFIIDQGTLPPLGIGVERPFPKLKVPSASFFRAVL